MLYFSKYCSQLPPDNLSISYKNMIRHTDLPAFLKFHTVQLIGLFKVLKLVDIQNTALYNSICKY